MKRITLERFENFSGEKNVVTYKVIKVVGSTTPYVGEKISADYACELCDQTEVWTVTFI